ncbi:hypothetical protein Tco_0255673 [Tanacetum coccineum]
MEDMECERIVAECWRKIVYFRNPDSIFRDKLKNVKEGLKAWSKLKFGGNDRDIESLKNEAAKWEIVAESRDLDVVELKDGKRQGKNGLMMDGTWCEDPVAIKAKVLEFYKNIFTECESSRPCMFNSNFKKISNEEKEDLEQDVIEDEKLVKPRLLLSVLVNGSPTLEFKMEIGVRQGDPLSPFLYLVAAEGLNVTIKEAVSCGYFKGVKIGISAIPITHLQYVDDTLIFREWKESNARNLMRIMECVSKHPI